MKLLLLIRDLFLALALLCAIALIANGLMGCSSTKKTVNKQATASDSTHLTKSIKTENVLITGSHKADSVGTTTKDNSNTFDTETVVTFDTADAEVIHNGNANDYSFKGKIKSVTVKSHGQILSKEVQQVSKQTKDTATIAQSSLQANTDSLATHRSTSSIQTTLKRDGFILALFKSWWWLGLIAIVAGFIFLKRNNIKSWIVKRIYKR